MAEREAWERCRFSTATLLNIQLPKGKKIKPTDLITFDWDKKSKPIELDDEALIQFLSNG